MTGPRHRPPRDGRQPNRRRTPDGLPPAGHMSDGRTSDERPAPRPTDRPGVIRDSEKRPSMERVGDLLSETARRLGLEDEFELATAMAAWQRVVSERVPAAAGACRLVGLSRGVATVEADVPIVAQELSLRSPELLAALRQAMPGLLLQLRIVHKRA